MKKASVDLHYEDRAAPQLLAGVLYQVVWTANRWLSLADDEVLVIEGDEDLVVATIKDGQVVSLEHGQIKRLPSTLTARASAAYETIFAFLCSFHTLSLEKKRCTFVLTTNAALGVQQVGPALTTNEAADPSRLCIDLLRTWRASSPMNAQRAAELTAGVKALVVSYVDRAYPARAVDAKGPAPSIDAARVRRAVEFLDEVPERTLPSDSFGSMRSRPSPRRVSFRTTPTRANPFVVPSSSACGRAIGSLETRHIESGPHVWPTPMSVYETKRDARSSGIRLASCDPWSL